MRRAAQVAFQSEGRQASDLTPLHPFKSPTRSARPTRVSPTGDAHAIGSEQQGAHYRCFPPRCHLHLLSAAHQRDEHRQWLPSLLPSG